MVNKLSSFRNATLNQLLKDMQKCLQGKSNSNTQAAWRGIGYLSAPQAMVIIAEYYRRHQTYSKLPYNLLLWERTSQQSCNSHHATWKAM